MSILKVVNHAVIFPTALFGALTASCGSGDNAITAPVLSSSGTDDSNGVTVNDGPEGDSGLVIGDMRYSLNAALGNIWGVSGNHFQIDFTLTNGNFQIESSVINGTEYQLLVPAEATAVFHASVFSPGLSFDYASYAHVPSQTDSALFSGTGHFKNAYVGLDTDDDGMVSRDERLDVLDGTVEFAGALPDIELRFQVTLSDGQSVSGTYTGLFDFTPR